MKKIVCFLIVAFLIIGIGHYFINPDSDFVSDFIYNIDVSYCLDEISKINFLHDESIRSLRFLSDSISASVDMFDDLKLDVPDSDPGEDFDTVIMLTPHSASEYFGALKRRLKRMFDKGVVEFWNSVVDFLSFFSNGFYFLFYGISFLLEFLFSSLSSFMKCLSIFIHIIFGYSI